MVKEKINSPDFQKLDALDTFHFTNLKRVECNICQSNKRTLLFKENIFKIFKCKNCGLVYAAPHPLDAELKEYYKFFFSGSDAPDTEKWNNVDSFNQAYALMKKYSGDRNIRILEIGCGYGHFLDLLKEKKYQNVTGIEPDAKIAKESRVRNPGVKIINSDFGSHEFKKDKFDAIIMLASLEHFPDPLHVLKQNYELLNDRGIIIIRVPCLEGFFWLNRFVGKNIVPFGAPRHLYDFNKNTLQQIIEIAGFETIELAIGSKETASNFVYDNVIKLIKLVAFLGDKAKFQFPSLFSGSLIAVGKKT